MRSWVLHATERLKGAIGVPGDKSISHRAILLGALADGVTEVTGLLRAQDCYATARAVMALGAEVTGWDADPVRIRGVGGEGLREPEDILDCANSGTTMRLLAGVLAGQPFLSVLTGDASLRRRPMRRVVEPLTAMGATILGRSGGQYPPLAIQGRELSGIAWESSVASAQVKSAILLAGLQARGETRVTEPMLSRDHTERMLRAFGVSVACQGTTVRLAGPAQPRAARLEVPGDVSSAAFFLVAAAVCPGSDVLVRNAGVNPTRTGVLDVLRDMGANIVVESHREVGGEPVADLRVRGRLLTGARIEGALIPRLLDDIPALAVAAALGEGETRITGAGELRVKETDRLSGLAGELAKLGAHIAEDPDGLRIVGGRRLRGAVVSSLGDHRMAMSLAIAALFAEGETTIQDVTCVATSFPGFAQRLLELAPGCGIHEVSDVG